MWRNHFTDVINASVKTEKLELWQSIANTLIFGIENILVVAYGALLVLNQDITIGMLFAFVAYKRLLAANLLSFVDRSFDFRLLTVHLDRIKDIVLAPQEQGLERCRLIVYLRAEVRNLNLKASGFDTRKMRTTFCAMLA